MFVDTASGRITSRLRIAGLRLGQFAVDEPGLNPYRMILPGAVWDLVRGRLVVDAERDVLPIVDLVHATESGPLAIAPRRRARQAARNWYRRRARSPRSAVMDAGCT